MIYLPPDVMRALLNHDAKIDPEWYTLHFNPERGECELCDPDLEARRAGRYIAIFLDEITLTCAICPILNGIPSIRIADIRLKRPRMIERATKPRI